MSRPSKTERPHRSVARVAARLRKAEHEQKIVALLNAGVSIAEIAVLRGVTERRIRQRVQEILAKRAPRAPAEFVALQVSRLNEALFVAYSAMGGQNLEAVDRVVRIVRELDRYHGLAAPDFADPPTPPRRLTRPQQPLALPAREEKQMLEAS
jgi:CelD/BcsL family acetyltransferase involved in cellulose biosynthesis